MSTWITATASFLKRSLWVERISAMGVIDREYFEALTCMQFESDRAAIRFFLANEKDASLGLSLNPLIETDWINQEIPGNNASSYSTLFTRQALFSTSPTFDARVFAAGLPSISRPTSTLAALKTFFRTATASTPMPEVKPSSGAGISWSDWRLRSLADARLFAQQVHLRRPRTSETWDFNRELKFIQSLDLGSATPSKLAVSIIMPTRNRINSLPDAVASVQSQTHRTWQLIIVDDGSTDSTVDYLTSLQDPRIKVIFQDSGGVSAARNAGLAVATGDFVAFLDSDNSWRERFLEFSLRSTAKFGRRAVHSGLQLNGDDGIVLFRGIDGDLEDLLYAGNFLDLNSLLVERALMDEIGGFDESIERWIDYDLFIAMARIEVPTYLPFLGVDYDDRSSTPRISGSELPSWEDVVVGKHLIDWPALHDAVDERVAGLTSVIIPTYTDWKMTATAIQKVLDNSGTRSIEILVIDNASRRHVYAILRAMFQGDTRVRIERMPRNLNFALANNYAFAKSHGEFVVALNNDTEVGADWLDPLVSSLERDSSVLGTQALLLYPDGTIQTAGTVFDEGAAIPRHALVGWPPEAAVIIDGYPFSAVTAAALCIRARDFVALHGFDPLYTNGLEDVDLCLRALKLRTGKFVVIRGSVVVHLESKTPGRAHAVSRNRALLTERWKGLLPRPDNLFHAGND